MKDCILFEGTDARAGEECEEEGEREVNCYKLTATPIIFGNIIYSNKGTLH